MERCNNCKLEWPVVCPSDCGCECHDWPKEPPKYHGGCEDIPPPPDEE